MAFAQQLEERILTKDHWRCVECCHENAMPWTYNDRCYRCDEQMTNDFFLALPSIDGGEVEAEPEIERKKRRDLIAEASSFWHLLNHFRCVLRLDWTDFILSTLCAIQETDQCKSLHMWVGDRSRRPRLEDRGITANDVAWQDLSKRGQMFVSGRRPIHSSKYSDWKASSAKTRLQNPPG